MDDAKKERVGKKLLAVLLAEGVTNPTEVLDLMRDGVIGAIEVIGHPTVEADDKLDEVPQPYLGVLRSIVPEDIYLVVAREGSLPAPERLVRVPKGAPEEKVLVAEKALSGPGRVVQRVDGAYLRAWVFAFTRSQGHRLSDLQGPPLKPTALATKVTFQ